jgi:hypothetical protein
MKKFIVVVMMFILHSVCFADQTQADNKKSDEARRDNDDAAIEQFNPDKYPSLGFSAGTDRFDAPFKYRSNTMLIDCRFPFTPWTTFWAEAGILKFEEGDQASSAGRHYRGGLRWYFHK